MRVEHFSFPFHISSHLFIIQMELKTVRVSSAYNKPKDILMLFIQKPAEQKQIVTSTTPKRSIFFGNNNNRNDKVEKIEINEKCFNGKIV